MSNDQYAWELADKHPDQFLSKCVFRDLYVDEFKFGRAASGRLDSNMISQYIIMPAHTQRKNGVLMLPVSENKLAIHLNCLVKASGLKKNTITIHVEKFHLTARSIGAQRMIDVHGPSVITADNSIHMNVNTGWGRKDNLRALAQEVDISDDQILHTEIRTRQGYNDAYMKSLVKEFRVKVVFRIHQFFGGGIVVKWKGDKTFPTE